MLDFKSRGPGFESLGHIYLLVGVTCLTLALALGVGVSLVGRYSTPSVTESASD